MKQKTGKMLLIFLLTLAMVVGLMPGMGMTAYAATWSGEGTQTNPYLISGLDDLIKLRDSVNAGTEYSGNYFRLTADIDCGADNWAPIGMEGYDNQGYEVNYYFKGIFDGNGKTVTYHVANADDEYNEYKGLFYKIPAGATVKNLSVAGFISGSGLYYGGIAGENGGTIQNCFSSVSITGSKYFYGGIAGINKKGTIDHCVASGVLTKNGSGYAYTAGIAGQNAEATVRDCVSLCDISAVNAKQSNFAGRVIGRNVSNGTAADCYYLSTANITGDAVNADYATGKTADELKAIGETAYNAGYTVYAQALGYTPHIHNFTYSADGATISATCTADGCTLSSNPILTIAAPTMTTYGEAGKSAVATLTGLSVFNTATGKTIAETDIKYVGRGDTTYAKSETAPTNAGTYTAKITVEGQTASVDYEIAKADPTANAPTGLSATYGQMLSDVTLTNPTGNTEGAWAWSVEDEANTSVGNAGDNTFKANFTPTDTVNYNSKSDVDVTITVDKADNPATVTGIASVTKGGNVDLAGNVTLNGATGAVSYAISGKANGCTLSGSTLTAGNNAGTVNVNITVAADDNYNASATMPVTVTINDKQTQTITAENVTATYGDTDKSVSASVTDPTTGGGAISYAVKAGSEDYIGVDATSGALTFKKVPADGKAYVTVTAAENDSYAQAATDVVVTIDKAEVTVPEIASKTYNAELQTADVAESTLYTVTINAGGTNVGDYNVVLTLADADNYKWTDSEDATKTLNFKITKADAVAATVTANNRIYDGTEKPLVTVTGEVTGGEMRYALGDASEATQPYTTSIPTAIDAGTYYVWYKVVGDDNHSDTEAKCIEVTISAVGTCTVTFDANGGSGSMDSTTVEKGSKYKLPGNAFTEPQGCVFAHWQIEENQYAADETITVTSDITIKAVWTNTETNSRIDTNDLTEVPESLKAQFETVKALENSILAKLSVNGNIATSSNSVFYDVDLMVSHDGINWVPATKENFPKGKLTVLLPYPSGTGRDTHNFSVAHMFTKEFRGHKPGEIETPTVTKTDKGIQFEVDGLSPVAVTWQKIDQKIAESLPQTGDGSNIVLWVILALLSIIGIAALVKKRT